MGQYDSDCTFKRSDTRRASRRRLTLIQRGPRHAMTNAVLLRNLPLTVRDVSSSGCLIESSAPLQVGTVGWLEVEFEGERRFEWFRIARVHTRGESAFLAGVEFLPLAAAGSDSLRSAIGRLRRTTPEWEARRWLDDRLWIPGTVHARSARRQPNQPRRSQILPGKSWISFDDASRPLLAAPLLIEGQRRTRVCADRIRRKRDEDV